MAMSPAPGNDSPGSVSLLLDQVKQGESEAFRALCERFLPTLIKSVDHRVASHEGIDTEVIANSVLYSLWQAMAERGRFQDVQDRDQLLRILAVIVRQKVQRHRRDAQRHKRDRRLTTHQHSFEMHAAQDPGPDLLVEIRESVQDWLAMLPAVQQQVVHLKVAGHSNVEIAHILKISLRSVERYLCAIRGVWKERAMQDGLFSDGETPGGS